MNPARQTYDYSNSGIMGGFISRSIDDVSWENTLDAHLNTLNNVPLAAPQSTAQNFDATQVTGSMGNTLQVGSVNINGSDGNITLANGGVTQMVLGQSTDGF